MQKLLIVLISTLILLLTACGSEETSPEDDNSSDSSSETTDTPEESPNNDENSEQTTLDGLPDQTLCGETGVYDDQQQGWLIGVVGNQCVYSEQSDRAKCRLNNSYAACLNFTGAQSVCEAGTTVGQEWYLPTADDLNLFYLTRDEGSPENTMGFCVEDSGICLGNTGGASAQVPYKYWGISGDTQQAISLLTGTISEDAETLRLSVRCVKRTDL